MPWFYKEPSDSEKEVKGEVLARIDARVHARIIGSRVLSGTVALVTGGAISIYDVIGSSNITPISIAANFIPPLIINGIAQIKIESALRDIGGGVTDVIHDFVNTEHRTELQPPTNET